MHHINMTVDYHARCTMLEHYLRYFPKLTNSLAS